MAVAETRGIRVLVQSHYLEKRSAPADGHYLFAYRVRITNVGSETAKLVSRTWIITDANGKQETVQGPGVVGEQPILDPGASFEYTSYCPLPTEVGSMHGAYQMITSDGTTFDAEIPSFTLAVPYAVN